MSPSTPAAKPRSRPRRSRVGSHTITASFTGSGGFGTSSGTAAPQVVNSVAASFPGIPYDAWIDFEGLTTGAAPTVSALASSTHGAAGSWTVTNTNNVLSSVTAAQDTLSGAPGTKGLQYNSTSSDPKNFVEWSMPSTHTRVSVGMYYCTSNESSSAFAYAEGPHFLGFDSNSFGDLWRLSDERNSVDNSREIRVSPTGPANAVMIPVKDSTCYWLTMRLVKGANVDFSVYDTNLNLIQHVTTPDAFNQNIDAIWLGSNLANGIASTFYNIRFDDLIVDYTNATFPLLPVTRPR